MAKRFHFDDEDEYVENTNQTSHIDELENKKKDHSFDQVESDIPTNRFEDLERVEKEENVVAKKKKFIWRWWHYVLIAFGVLFIALMVYVFVVSSHEGPVYGSRCEGIVTIPTQHIDSSVSQVKKKYSEVKDISFEIACKQLKVDIVFKDGMNTKKAKTIAEDAIQILDKAVGMEKDKGKTYSHLFGYENKVSQFEVNLFLESSGSKDFPIYGTKHVSKDDFAYTLSSVKDKDSKDKAESTLKK